MQPTRVRKAVAYVVRADELLVLTHRDRPLEETGIQVPAGTVRDDESPTEAVLRELTEETGLTDCQLVGLLGIVDYDVRPARDEIHERHVFHVLAPLETADTWEWAERHDGLQIPTPFVLSWLPISQAHVLAGGMGALLGRLPRGVAGSS